MGPHSAAKPPTGNMVSAKTRRRDSNCCSPRAGTATGSLTRRWCRPTSLAAAGSSLAAAGCRKKGKKRWKKVEGGAGKLAAALLMTRASTARLCLRRWVIESARRPGARGLPDGALASCLLMRASAVSNVREGEGEGAWGAYGSCVEQCGSVSACAQRDLISLSNPRPGSCSL